LRHRRADEPDRDAVIKQLATHLASVSRGHPLRVAIDGVCGAGKSTFAGELAAALEQHGRPVVLLDSDGFHHIRARRYRNQDDLARGYYEDAYDFDSLANKVLRPLGPGGWREYATKVHDLASDDVVRDATAVAPPDAVLIFAATFVQSPQLDGLWDEVIYLDADEDAALARGIARDADALGGESAARTAYEARYLAAWRIYSAERAPRSRASIVVEHTDPAAPVLERVGAVGGKAHHPQ
jgi:uridine kinase